MKSEDPPKIVISAQEAGPRLVRCTVLSSCKTDHRTPHPNVIASSPSTDSIAPVLHGRGLLFTVAQLPVGISPSRSFFSCNINGKDFKRRTVHPEPDIASGKGKSVNPFGIILIGRARIKGQNLTQRLPFACGESLQDFPRGTHLKPGLRLRSRKTACRLRDTVGVGKVGFYIQNRGSVQQVGPRNP